MAQEEKKYELTKKQIAEFVILGIIAERTVNGVQITREFINNSIIATVKDLDSKEDSKVPNSARSTIDKILKII